MKWYWKILIGLGSLLLLITVLTIGLNLWLKFQLPKVINRENDSAYFITYKNLDVSLLYSHININEIVVVPKAALKDSVNKAGIYAKILKVEVTDFKIWDLAFSDRLKAKSILVDQPKVILYQKKEQEDIRKDVVVPFEKIIKVSDIFVKRGDLKIIRVANKDAVLSANNINLNVAGIVITESILKSKIPFNFKNYLFTCDSLYYHPNEFYHIKTKKINSSRTDLNIEDFEMTPTYSRREFVAKIPKEKDLFTLSCKTIAVDKINWGFKQDDFFFHCNAINLDHAAANIYRSKVPADDLRKKYLYNKLLRDLEFDLKIDSLNVRNSVLEYEEQKSPELGAAKLIFNPFNLTATSINSGFKKTKLPDLKIKINCRFMNDCPMNVNWKFNVMDKSDGFNISGRLTNFDAEKITSFSKPYINVTTKGVIDEVRFHFTGNDKQSSGSFKVEYDDLKFTVYRKDNPKKKNKFLTFITRIFVKKNTKDKLKETDVQVARIPEKSFYNLLWRSIEEGLKKILV